MKALITGASSGLGWEMAKILSEKGYDIIAVARRKDRLELLKQTLKTNTEIVVCDLSDADECKALARFAPEVDILINNAGFGVFGELCETDLDKELKMLDTNSRAMHILTKLFAQEFKKRDSGRILNVASIAAFFPGPLFSGYYASKAYVYRLTQSLAEELRKAKSKVTVSVLCPGPVHTEFEDAANVSFGTGTEKMGKGMILESKFVAEYAIKKFLKGKLIIVPGKLMKLAAFSRHIVSEKFLAKCLYFVQSKKMVKR